MKGFITRLLRSTVSYFPSSSLLGFRRIKDLPLRFSGQPHEDDFLPLRRLQGRTLVILDVGANRGQSIESFRQVLSNPRIHAIEPNPMLAEFLRIRYPDVVVHAVGLNDVSGEAEIHIPRYGHTLWDTRASLEPSKARSFLEKQNFLRFNENRAGLESYKVKVITLDELQLIPDILKIDAEGHEGCILRGAITTITSSPIILLEGAAEDTVDFLSIYGYLAYHSVGDQLEPGIGKLNTYFLSPIHHADFTNS